MAAIVRSRDIEAVVFATHRIEAAAKAATCYKIHRGKLVPAIVVSGLEYV